jgi:protein ImuB
VAATRTLTVWCPDLYLDGEEVAELRAFEPVVVALEAICPWVEVIRPGLCAFATKGPARYFGGDAALAQVVLDALPDGMAKVGIADGRFASGLAARVPTIVPAGRSAAFLAPYHVEVLERPALADLLIRLGIRTLGDLAALPGQKVAARFGPDGSQVHRLCRGLDNQPLTARIPPPDLAVEQRIDPACDLVEPLAFVAKSLAGELRDTLAARGLACTRILIEVQTEHGEQRSRLWRYDDTFTVAAIAQRVRWQLTGWLSGPEAERPSSGVTLLRLTPDEVHRDIGRQLRLFGDATDADERAAVTLARLQGLVGFDEVCTAVLTGGRDLVSYTRLIPWGEPRPRPYDGKPPWPGRLPSPTPTLVYPEPLPAEVRDASGQPVSVTDRGTVSAAPQRISVARTPPVDVTAWAGPWVVAERWWDPAGCRCESLFQLVTADGVARLLAVTGSTWAVQGRYD